MQVTTDGPAGMEIWDHIPAHIRIINAAGDEPKQSSAKERHGTRLTVLKMRDEGGKIDCVSLVVPEVWYTIHEEPT